MSAICRWRSTSRAARRSRSIISPTRSSAASAWRWSANPAPANPSARSSILKLLPYPTASHPSGSIRFKGRELLGLSEHEMRGIRGNDISIIFQEPMTSLNPLHTIE